MAKQKVRLRRSLTASQSPTGKALSPGDEITVDPNTAADLRRRGAAEDVAPPAPALRAEK